MKPLIRGPVALRLFLFNLLLIFVPVAGFLSFKAYESALLEKLEHALVQEARALAAWLSEEPLTGARAREVIARLEKRHTSRIRVVDTNGLLLADSSSPRPGKQTPPTEPETTAGDRYYPDENSTGSVGGASADTAAAQRDPQSTLVYRILSIPVRLWRSWFQAPRPPLNVVDWYSGREKLDGPEVLAALEGRYGAMTRVSGGGQSSVTLYSAVPIRSPGAPSAATGTTAVSGAVLVSQSSWRILVDLYALRLDVGKIFLYSLAIAILVSILMALTISRPLARLEKEARQLDTGPLPHKAFTGSGRNDETDTLARALNELVARLGERIDWATRFAADASHELRNPIAGIQAQAELLSEHQENDTRQRARTIASACERMNATIRGLRALALLEKADGTMSGTELEAALGDCAERCGKGRIDLSIAPGLDEVLIHSSRNFIEMALSNLIDNALSFTPPDSRIDVQLSRHQKAISIAVRDRGPGIPADKRESVFERFRSERRDDAEHRHSGLGLAIVRAVAEQAGGRAWAAPPPEAGGPGITISMEFPDFS